MSVLILIAEPMQSCLVEERRNLQQLTPNTYYLKPITYLVSENIHIQFQAAFLDTIKQSIKVAL